MENLNKNEAKVLRAICEGCDEIDGWGFHRPSMMMRDVLQVFERVENLGQVAGGYVRDLIEKDLIEFNAYDDEVWVRPEVFSQFVPTYESMIEDLDPYNM